MKHYTPLHLHTHYSLLDGLSKPEDVAKRCHKLNMTSCAVTDHGSISGCINFFQTMKHNKIKPILGVELYISDQDSNIQSKENRKLSHMLLLSKNLAGWKNLIEIVSESNRPDNYYYKPRLDIAKLKDRLSQGNIIGMSGHPGSYLANKIYKEEKFVSDSQIEKEVGELSEIFGKDNFFVEVQLMDQENEYQQIIGKKLRDICNLNKIPKISSIDSHYCERYDAVDQRILLCSNLKMTLPQVASKLSTGESFGLDSFFKSDSYHLLSHEEMNEVNTEDEIDNTNLVDSMCEDYDILETPNLPDFKCPEGYDPAQYLRQLCRDGWKNKIVNNVDKELHSQYVDRIKYELDVLQGADLSSYFLIVQDIVDHVRKQKWLPGPGRGSAAGCLVSYLIGITAIDPIKYDLIFERFYNAGRNTGGRVSMPDIDVDVPMDQRENIIDYIKDTYGQDKVSQMITYNTLKGRGSLKEVLRVYSNISFEEMNQITKHIPDEAKIADELQEMKDASIIKWALENNPKPLKDWCHLKDDKLVGPLAKRFEQAIRLEGTKCNQSKHAAGIAISQSSLSSICPMIYDTKTKKNIAGLEMNDLESIGVVKFDILGIGLLDKMMGVQSLLQGV
jgi:DNA polymerase III subunit alpha